MRWLDGFSPEDIREMVDDARQAFHNSHINEKEFRETLGKLGHNATDIEDEVKAFMPRGSDVED